MDKVKPPDREAPESSCRQLVSEQLCFHLLHFINKPLLPLLSFVTSSFSVREIFSLESPLSHCCISSQSEDKTRKMWVILQEIPRSPHLTWCNRIQSCEPLYFLVWCVLWFLPRWSPKPHVIMIALGMLLDNLGMILISGFIHGWVYS